MLYPSRVSPSFFQLPGKIRQQQKVEDCMEHYPVAPAAILGREGAIVVSEEEIGKRNIFLDASIAAEKLAIRAETTARAVIAAEAIVALALSAVTSVASTLDAAAQETLLVAKKTAAKTLEVAKKDADETLALAKDVAEALLEHARRKNVRYAPNSTQRPLEDS